MLDSTHLPADGKVCAFLPLSLPCKTTLDLGSSTSCFPEGPTSSSWRPRLLATVWTRPNGPGKSAGFIYRRKQSTAGLKLGLYRCIQTTPPLPRRSPTARACSWAVPGHWQRIRQCWKERPQPPAQTTAGQCLSLWPGTIQLVYIPLERAIYPISISWSRDRRHVGSLFCISISDPLEIESMLYGAYVVIPGLALKSCRSFLFSSSLFLLWPPIALWWPGRGFLWRRGTQCKEGWLLIFCSWGSGLRHFSWTFFVWTHLLVATWLTGDIFVRLGYTDVWWLSVYRMDLIITTASRKLMLLRVSVRRSEHSLLTSWHSFIKKSVSEIEIHFPYTRNIPGAWWQVVINPLPGVMRFEVILVHDILNSELGSYCYF